MKPAASNQLPWPRLSQDLPGPVHPQRCQSCGVEGEEGLGNNPVSLTRWIEHDDRDKPEPIIVVLCKPCGERLIAPHKRLYDYLPVNKPYPGCMEICAECRFRDALRCTHPDLKANGGHGLTISCSHPHYAHICVSPRRNSFTMATYAHSPGPCAGRRRDPGKPLLTAAGEPWAAPVNPCNTLEFAEKGETA